MGECHLGAPNQVGDVVRGSREEVLSISRQLPGFSGARFMVKRAWRREEE
jgi:hypothetical protein